jgi:hypothetical protein
LNDSQQPRPSFSESFPRVPELDALVEAFGRGDYRRVRAGARDLASRAGTDDAVRKAALTLIERTEPDPLAVALLALAGVLLITLSAWWIVHAKAPPVEAPPAPRIEHVR